jgi:hypothetical protein
MTYLYEGLMGKQDAKSGTAAGASPARDAKTVWSTVATTFSGGRRLAEEEVVLGAGELPLERALYSSTGNAPNWCNFQGVTCGFSTTGGSGSTQTVSSNSYVVENIDISNLGLTGSLPNNIGNLKFMKTFLVNGNKLTGSIPTGIGAGYLQFKTIQLDNNQFSGPIPSQIGELTELTTLTLNSNALSGTIPVQMSQMTALTSFKAQSNNLFGDSPDFKVVKPSNFAQTLRNTVGGLNMDNNCLSYTFASGDTGGYATTATGCKPTMRKFSIKEFFKRYF